MGIRQGAFVVVAALLLGSTLRGLEPGKPSKTSVWVLAARAIGTHDPDPTVRNPDWLAERFLGPEERALLAGHPVIRGLDQDYRLAMRDPETKARVLMVNIRTRIIDQQLLAAVDQGVQQVVILGAGFDSRAYRFRQQLRNAQVFEVDFGPTQEYKRRRVLDVLGAVPPNLRYVPVDFTKQKLSAELRRRGYRPERKTLFIWEGVSMYLTQPQVRDFLSDIATHTNAQSEIIFDHFNPFFDPPNNEANAHLVAMLKEWGEPWIFAIPDGKEAAFLGEVGLRMTEHLSMRVTSDDARKFIVRQDGSSVGDVEFPPAGAPVPRTVHWVAVARLAYR